MELILSIVIGVTTGVIASWLFWFLLYYGLAPKIAFSHEISKRASKARGCGYEYSIKLYNIRKRSAVDVQLTAYVTIPGLSSPVTDDVYYVPLGTNRIMEMIPKSKPGRNANLVILNLDKERFIKIFNRPYFPDSVRSLAAEGKLSLEDVLRIRDGSYFRLLVKLNDSISGAVKVCRSKDYILNDIVFGKFKKKALSVVPFSEEEKAKEKAMLTQQLCGEDGIPGT